MLTFLTLLIAHLIGDFVFQRNAVVAGKLNGLWIAWFEHLLTHGALLIAVWWLIQPLSVSLDALGLAFGAIVISHGLIDWAKVRWGQQRELAAFLIDQLAHILVLLLMTAWLLSGLQPLRMEMLYWHPLSPAGAAIIAGYAVVVFACGWMNRLLLQSLAPDDLAETNLSVGLADAGLRIGWLERFLLLSAFLAEAWAALGLVLAAKSVFRFGDLRKGRRHAEYFLIGTLLSVSQVVLLGALLKLILQHLSL